ncbi:MAG: hypothetical protein ABL977_13820, partial [Candidatus Eisenbacteria bacterium]
RSRIGTPHWREAVFATCTVWLVLQNLVLLAFVVWGSPASALAASAAVAKTAVTLGAPLLALALAAMLGLALAAWLVHVPAERVVRVKQEVDHER